MNDKAVEMFATALSHIGIIPSFDGALLFTDDISDITGFQVKCNKNEAGRMVFSYHNVGITSLQALMNKYKEIHGNPIRTSTTSKHDINVPIYPAFGADYEEDLSPSTIVNIVRAKFEESNEMVGILPAYVLQLTQEIQRWEEQFKKLYEQTKTLREVFTQVFEESF